MPSISDTLRTTASRRPDTIALKFDGRERTYAELASEVERVASVIAAHGVGTGDRVMLLSGNTDAFVIAAYAALRTGAILVPTNPNSAAPEVAYLLQDSGASMLLCTPELAELAAAGAAESENQSVQTFALGAGTDFTDLFATAAADAPAPLADWPAESDDAMLLYTSGTTGRPKGALFDHHRIMWVAVGSTAVCGLREGDRMLHAAPLYHAAELCIMLFSGTMLGVTHNVAGGFDPVTIADTLERERITSFFGTPTMYQFLLRVPGFADRDLSEWRVGMFGAAPMPASVVTTILEVLPQVKMFQLCGQTEGGPGGVYSPPEDVAARPDASGRYALTNTECRIVDADGSDVAAGEVGELILRGETIMKRYWNKPNETAATLRDGWLHTGDLMLLDADGYMTLVDRLKDMIITGGRNVYSVEVENAIAGHPDVIDVAVLGIPHEDYGESILAVVTLRDGATLELGDLRAFVRERISTYKAPHAMIISPLPRNASGKLQKHILRDELDLGNRQQPAPAPSTS